MNKTLMIVASTVLAAACSTTAAHARGGNDRFFSGLAPSFSHSASPRHDRHFHRPRFHAEPTRTYVAPPREERRQAAQPAVKFADGLGREYDFASKVWFDGKGTCFTGKQVWTFKSGAWSYGNARWSLVNGTWSTTAAVAPVAVDCSAAPVFAARMKPAPELKGSTKRIADTIEGRRNEVAEVAQDSSSDSITTSDRGGAEKSASASTQSEGAANRAPGCKKYFASVGQMLPVPCSD